MNKGDIIKGAWKIENKIGSGAFGDVYSGIFRNRIKDYVELFI